MERNTTICPKCDREISLSNITKHTARCIDGIIRQKYMPSQICENCGKEVHVCNYNKHYNACLLGYSRPVPVGLGPQNHYTKAKRLGLPKPEISQDTRKLLAKSSKNRIWTDEQRKVQSDHAIRRGIGGQFVNKRITYNGISLGSSYELKVAISLDENNITWEKPKSFSYIDPSGKSRKYTPDFYLPEYDLYLDPKNDFLIININPSMGFTDTEKITLVMNQNSINVIILDKNNLTWDSIRSNINLLILSEIPM